ncbi:MAG: cytochrome b N-terminal domain-containing protein [Actinobacteria bacterium]|nr:cytochrome b N-terminal domain-containing protein [Actinomycetota bacterium]
MISESVRFVDERVAAARGLRKVLRYVFPDHWSFLLGEVALYAFMILVATGIYLTLFFDPSLAKVTYHGAYGPLRGAQMSEAYRSVVDISFKYKAGDLLSGMGLAIGYSVALSIPLIGGPLGLAIWGAPFPGNHDFESRMYIGHVLLFPVLIGTLIAVHLALVAARHHTQFRRDYRHTEQQIVGVPLFPGQTPRSLSLLFAVAAVLFLLGGLVQINPIWQWGPYETALGTNGAQPDWYLGWLIGALRLMPSFDVTIGHYTLVPNPFWGGALFPLVVLSVLALIPWAERKLTRDRSFHNLLERPRDAPNRTAFGVAFFVWVLLIFIFGGADRVYVLFDLSYELQLLIFRIAIWVLPAVLFFLVRRWCRQLQAADRIDAEQEQAEREAEEERTVAAAAASPGA